MPRCTCGQPLSEPSDRVRPVGDDPEGDIDGASGIFRRVVRASPELRGTPVPGNDHATEKSREARVFGEADDDVEIPDTPAATQVMLSAALCERDDAHPVLPAGKVRVTREEGFDLGFSGTPQSGEIGLVKAFVGASGIAVSTCTRHVWT